jgi:hypothetical protein
MEPASMIRAAERLGCKVGLDSSGPWFKMPSVRLNPSVERERLILEAIAQLRRVMNRHRSSLIRFLGGDPKQFSWVPAEGSEERTWYDFIESCLKDEPGVYKGQSGKVWHTRHDAQRLLDSCENTEQWKKEARCFWWDCLHSAESWKADDYNWPLLKG